MSRALLILANEPQKMKAISWVKQSPWGTRLEFKKPKRTLEQNDKLWAMLTDVASQIVWHGQRLSPADWKLVFMASLKKEMRIAPTIEGTGFVNLGTSSSDLSKEEISDLFMVIEKFGAQHGVVFKDKAA